MFRLSQTITERHGAWFLVVGSPKLGYISPMEKMNQIGREFEALRTESSKKLWALYTTGMDFGVSQAREKTEEFLKDKNRFKEVTKAREHARGPLDQRKMELLYNEFKWHHLSEEANLLNKEMRDLQLKLEDIINKHRPQIDGVEVNTTKITDILLNSPSREERKKAYLSRTQINKKLVDAGFIQLLDLRKEYAVACGRKNFVALKLEENELTTEIFDSWAGECAQRKDRLHQKESEMAQRFFKQDALEPWDYSYLRSQVCTLNNHKVDIAGFYEPTKNLFKKYGFDLEGMNITFDLFPRKNKSEWGYNFTIEKGVDSRVLANVNDFFYNYWVLLHETAHGVHFLGLDPNETLLNLGVSGIVAEGFANFFGDLAYSKEFLAPFFPDDFERAVAEFKALKSIVHLSNFEAIQQTLFDQKLYTENISSQKDIEDLVWKTRKDLLGKDPYAGEPLWGHLIHHTVAPIYLHNYFLGDVMCDTMKKVFKAKTGNAWSDRPAEFGGFWKQEVLAPSGELPFLELSRKVCGRDLSIGAYLESALG